MKYFVNVNGRGLEVTLEERGDELWANIGGGKSFRVDYAEVDGLGQYAISLDQQSYAASIEGVLGKYTVGLSGDIFQIQLQDEREKAAELLNQPHGGGKQVVESVMPGVIVKILVNEGDSVESQQALLILEAMKMQNEIRAEGPGKVKKLHVKIGQSVSGGDALVTIE